MFLFLLKWIKNALTVQALVRFFWVAFLGSLATRTSVSDKRFNVITWRWMPVTDWGPSTSTCVSSLEWRCEKGTKEFMSSCHWRQLDLTASLLVLISTSSQTSHYVTHSFGVDNINDGADLSLVLPVVDEHNTANFDKASKSLKTYQTKNKMSINCLDVRKSHWCWTEKQSLSRLTHHFRTVDADVE